MFNRIKKYLCLFIFLSYAANVWAETEAKAPLSHLTAMTEVHKKSNYELLYILQQDDSTESFRLRHAFKNEKEYAQLLNLDSSREEIILRNQTVSYLGNNFRPFSLNSPYILDNLPNVIYTDYTNLKGYTFLEAGRDRISDRIAKVIRVVPNDNYHYAYTLWIDEDTHILLKSQLLSQNNTVLEEFRVLQLYQSPELEMISSVIDSLMLPALSSVEKASNPSSYDWKTKWLPVGFKLVEKQSINGKPYFVENENIDSRLYSDGLFTFNIYIMPSQGVNFNEYAFQQGKLTILNQTVNDKDVVIIGEIPLEAAKEILKNLHFAGEKSQ